MPNDRTEMIQFHLQSARSVLLATGLLVSKKHFTEQRVQDFTQLHSDKRLQRQELQRETTNYKLQMEVHGQDLNCRETPFKKFPSFFLFET